MKYLLLYNLLEQRNTFLNLSFKKWRPDKNLKKYNCLKNECTKS